MFEHYILSIQLFAIIGYTGVYIDISKVNITLKCCGAYQHSTRLSIYDAQYPCSLFRSTQMRCRGFFCKDYVAIRYLYFGLYVVGLDIISIVVRNPKYNEMGKNIVTC